MYFDRLVNPTWGKFKHIAGAKVDNKSLGVSKVIDDKGVLWNII